MTQTFDGTSGFQKTFVYLEDDRIEVGRLGFAYTEDLSRVAYRDVRAVVFHGARRALLIRLAVLPCLVGLGFLVAAYATYDDGPAGRAWLGFLVFSVVAFMIAGTVAWFGRKGTATGFRVDGPHTSVKAVIGAGRAKQERFKRELLARIEDAKRRAVNAVN